MLVLQFVFRVLINIYLKYVSVELDASPFSVELRECVVISDILPSTFMCFFFLHVEIILWSSYTRMLL